MAALASSGLDMSPFKRWVRRYGGAPAVAKDLGVQTSSVYYWIRRQGWPKVELILGLIELSRGELTFAQIVYSTCEPSKLAYLPKTIVRDATTKRVVGTRRVAR